MNYYNNRIRLGLVLALVIAVSLSVLLIAAGCTDRLSGEQYENQKPIVYFVNIPPEGQQFSVNPVVHWVGTDRDGLIVLYQYHVATADELGGLAPLDYIATLPPDVITRDTVITQTDSGLDTTIVVDTVSSWVRLSVDLKGPDPQTSNTISMTADLDDPVRTFVDQYVFVQAFDEQGLGSDIVYRLFSRNDNPPNTVIYNFSPTEIPFVNSVHPGGIITGVKIRWAGSDDIDYPSDPPPFEFQWRLYGPYNRTDSINIDLAYMTQVYVTNDGLIYNMGDTIFRCDTTFGEGGLEIECDTTVVTPDIEESAFGSLEDHFRCDDPDFLASPFYGGGAKLVETSDGWVLATADTLWNVYRSFHSDTTLLMKYIFWIRSRDDATVPDLVPAFKWLEVINPRYERDVAVLDFTRPLASEPNFALPAVKRAYWKKAIDAWGAQSGYEIEFDTVNATEGVLANASSSPDFMNMGSFSSGAPLGELLKHKVLILYNDDIGGPGNDQWSTAYKAIDAGINVWLTMRCPLASGGTTGPQFAIPASSDYEFYFGVESMDFSAWYCYLPQVINIDGDDTTFLVTDCDENRGFWQDFVGALSRRPGEFPSLSVDTALLHASYQWRVVDNFWVPERAALPEVDWSVRSYGTEILYKYSSLYGPSHPLGFDYSFHGRPVAHRYETSLFRTAHFNFTPLAMGQDSMQVVVNLLLDWLYDPSLSDVEVQSVRYDDAQVSISLAQARELYRERCRREDREKGFDPLAR